MQISGACVIDMHDLREANTTGLCLWSAISAVCRPFRAKRTIKCMAELTDQMNSFWGFMAIRYGSGSVCCVLCVVCILDAVCSTVSMADVRAARGAR